MYKSLPINEIRKRMEIGKLVRVRWDDVGATDCMVIKKHSSESITAKSQFAGYFFGDRTISYFDADQIIAIGEQIRATAFQKEYND